MSNKETLQQHNTRLSENNIEIEDILNIANSLPTIDEAIILQDKTVEPSTKEQTVTADEEYNGLGTVTVKGDSDLIPENIKKGVNIFGVDGEIEVIDYWNETSVYPTDFNFKYYMKEIPKNLDVSQVTNFYGIFDNCSNFEKLDLSSWDTTQATTLQAFFRKCTNLKEVIFSEKFNCTNCKSFGNMFSDCQSLKSIDLSHFSESKATDISYMFLNCYELLNLDISNFNTSTVTKMRSVFSDCKNLTRLDLSHFDTSNVTDMYSMFQNCQSLMYLDIRNFTFDSVTNKSYMFSNVPRNCEIIVKSDTERDWVLTQRSDFTNVKTVAEL